MTIPKPCPFCASEYIQYTDEAQSFWCQSCGTQGPMRDGREGSLAAWNRRAVMPSDRRYNTAYKRKWRAERKVLK